MKTKIEQLRDERRSKLAAITGEITRIKESTMYSDSHKEKVLGELRDDLKEVKKEYGERIDTLIRVGKQSLLKKALTPGGDELSTLRMQVNTLHFADDLIFEYGQKPLDIGARMELLAKAQEAVELQLPNAGGYIRALKRLMVDDRDVKELAAKHEELSRTPEQAEALKELKELEKAAGDYEAEVIAENLAAGGGSLQERIAMKGRLHQLGHTATANAL